MEVTDQTVFAVIVTWNGAGWIAQALESLRRSTVPVRVLVVDNASQDDTVQIVQDSFPEVETLCLPANVGFGQANNKGIRLALSYGADYLLLLNQDAKVAPATVETLVEILNDHPDFGIVSPLHLDYQGTGIDQIFLKFIRTNGRLLSDAFACQLQKIYEAPFMPAAIWLLPRQVFEQVGGFAPFFFMYGEDRDFCDRVKLYGFKVGVAPTVVAYHWHDHHQGKIRRPLTTQYNLSYATFIYELTRPEQDFVPQFVIVFVRWGRKAVIELLYRDFKNVVVTGLVLVRGVLNIFSIWKHHNQLQREWGASATNFLDSEQHSLPK